MGREMRVSNVRIGRGISLGVPQIPAWTPNNETGVSVYDPAAYSAGLLANMKDASPRGADFLQATGGLKPTVVATGGPNNQARIQWNAKFVKEATGKFSAFTEGEILWVFKLTADPPAAGLGCMWRLGADGVATAFQPFTDGTIYENFGTTVRKTTVNPTPDLSAAWHVYDVISKAGEFTVLLDGVQIFTTATNAVGFPSADARIGAHDDTPLNYMQGESAYLAISDHKFGSTFRTNWTAYALARWGLTA